MLGNTCRCLLKMKGKVYRCCVRSAILYGSEVWCLKNNEKTILRRTKGAMVRAMCGQEVVDRKTTEELMEMLGSACLHCVFRLLIATISRISMQCR